MKNNDDSTPPAALDHYEEARAMFRHVISRLMIWVVDAPTLAGRGLRFNVMLFCIRPDLVDGATLEEIGDGAGCTRQAVHKLARDFRLTLGLLP